MKKIILLILLLYINICYSSPVQVIVPYSPGGGGDIIFRIFEEYCATKNIQLVPAYKSGADGIVGLLALSKSNNDVISIAGTVSISRTIDQNPHVNFVYISLLSIPTFVLVSSAETGITSIAELTKFKDKKSIVIGSGGASHLNLINQLSKNLNITDSNSSLIVPYKGTKQMISDIIGNRIDVGFLLANIALNYEKSGKMKILAATSEINGYTTVLLEEIYNNWTNINAYGLLLPLNASKESINFWKNIVKDFLNDKTVQRKLINDNSIIPTFGSESFKNLVNHESK